MMTATKAKAKMDATMQALQEDRKSWHFEKRLSVDTLVGIVGVAIVVGGPVLIWGRAMENRVLTLENTKTESDKQESKRDADTREQRVIIGGRLDKIDEKMTTMQIAVGQLATQLAVGQLTTATTAAAVAASPRPVINGKR